MPPSLERSISAASKLKRELPTDIEMESSPPMELLSLVEYIHVKTREASQNPDLNMREFVGIDKALKSIQVKLLNNTCKLTEIDKRIKRDTEKLEEVENDLTYSDEQKRLYRDRLDDLNTTKQARLEIEMRSGDLEIRQGWSYGIEKIFKHRLQGLNKPLKRFLIKIHH